jgi:hypothetical protein
MPVAEALDVPAITCCAKATAPAAHKNSRLDVIYASVVSHASVRKSRVATIDWFIGMSRRDLLIEFDTQPRPVGQLSEPTLDHRA